MIYRGASQWHYYLGINPKRFVINKMKILFVRLYQRICRIFDWDTGERQVGLGRAEHYRRLCKYVNNMTWSEVAFGAQTSHSKLMEIFFGGGNMVALRIGWEKNVFFGTVLKSQWRSDVRPTNFSIDFSYSLTFFILSHYVRFLESPHFYCTSWENLQKIE